MAQNFVLSTPSIVINNRTISIVPNSLEITKGRGEREVKNSSSGGTSSQIVVSFNAEKLVSEIKFKKYSTPDAIELFDELWNSGAVIEISDPQFSGSFEDCVLTEDAKVNFSQDGEIEFTFKGKKGRW